MVRMPPLALLSLHAGGDEADTNFEICAGSSCGKIVKSLPVLRWMPTKASDANTFFGIGRDGVTAEIRRCWACVEETRCRVVDSLFTTTKRSHEQMGVECYHSCLLVGQRMNVENRWNVDSWSAFRGLFALSPQRGASAAWAHQDPRPHVVHLLSGGTLALCHEGRLEKVRCDSRLCSVFWHCCSWAESKASHRRVSGKDWKAHGT